MGNCITSQKKNFSKDNVMDGSVCVIPEDRPYEERTREERMDNETRQMIRALNRYGN